MSLLDAIRRVKRSPPRFAPDGDPGPPVELAGRRVLLVYLFPALGDAVLLGPVVQALANGGAKEIGVVVRAAPARILKLLELPRARIIVHEEGAAGPPPKLARGRWDIAVDLTARADADSASLMEASGAPVRLGWGAPEDRRSRLTHATPDVRHQAERHWSRYQMLPLRCLGLSQPDYAVSIRIDAPSRARARALFGPRPWVLLVPGARDPRRRAPPQRFVELGRWVVREAKGSVVVTGSPDEAELARSITKPIGDGASRYTQKSLSVLAALIAEADVVVTNDTGPMHLAFLMRRPTLAVFTWMSPLCWGPPQPDPRFVVVTPPAGAEADETKSAVLTRALIHYLDGLLPGAR